MFKRTLVFIKNASFILLRSKVQLKPLFRLTLSLAVYDFKTTLSILFFSIESLASVLKYQKEGRRIVNLIDVKEKINIRKNKLFILGSGPSVNEHTQDDWRYIKENDSWGFNFWFCNSYVPSTYIAQALIEPEPDKELTRQFESNKMLCKMLSDKKETYMGTEFLIRGDAVNKRKFFNTEFGRNIEKITGQQGSLLAELIVSSSSKISPKILLDRLFEYGFYHIKNEIQIIPKFGSTISELISLALMLGYKEIVLCGIDMNDGGHFYDNEEMFQRYPLLRKMSKFNHTRTSTGGHEHMDVSIRPFTVKEYIIALKEFATEKFNANIYVMNESSALYPDIPKYKINV